MNVPPIPCRMWMKPKGTPYAGQIRYYVNDLNEVIGLDVPKEIKVWLSDKWKIHVNYCNDSELEKEIVRRIDALLPKCGNGRRYMVSGGPRDTTYKDFDKAVKRMRKLMDDDKTPLHFIRCRWEGEMMVITMRKDPIRENEINEGALTPSFQWLEFITLDDFTGQPYLDFHYKKRDFTFDEDGWREY
mgnify:CR=1 FL=1